MARRQITDETIEKAELLRGQGETYRAIGRAVGISHVHIQKLINPTFGIRTKKPLVAENDNVVVRAIPFNGGHSTAENPYSYVAMPRVSFIDGIAA